MKWIEQWRMLHRKEPEVPIQVDEPRKWSEDADVDALKFRIDELLADNDSLQERLWAMSHAMIAMAEKIEELEHAK